MVKRTLLIIFSVIALCCTGFCAKLPNIIFILADDMGYGDLSCQNPHGKITTPNLDQLAIQGMRFTNAHSSGSVCVPSRYGLMTGRMPWRKGTNLGINNHVPLIEKDRFTLPKLLHQAGYETAAFGKWHLGWDWPWKPDTDNKERRREDQSKIDFKKEIGGGPIGAGFDYSFGVDHPTYPNAFIENGYTIGIPGSRVVTDENGRTALGVKGWDIYDMLPALTRKTVAYITEKGERNSGIPFFVYFALTAPHTPLVPTEEFQGKSGIGPYGDFVLQCDDIVGQVLKALDKAGLADDTMVIFSSDNGSPAKNAGPKKGTLIQQTGHNPSGGQSGFKGDAWEGGHHVPFIIRWPGHVPAGAVNDDLLCQVDMLATFAALTRRDFPVKDAMDSRNALPLFLGDKPGPNGRSYLVHRSQTLFHTRQGDWKLILGSGAGGLEKNSGKSDPDAWQLYNLQSDPAEKNNLFRKYPEIEANLERLLRKEQQRN